MLKHILFLLLLTSGIVFGGDDNDFQAPEDQPKGEFKNEPEEEQPRRERKGFKRGPAQFHRDYLNACDEYLVFQASDADEATLKELFHTIIRLRKDFYFSQIEGIEECPFLKDFVCVALLFDLYEFNQSLKMKSEELEFKEFWSAIFEVLRGENLIDDNRHEKLTVDLCGISPYVVINADECYLRMDCNMNAMCGQFKLLTERGEDPLTKDEAITLQSSLNWPTVGFWALIFTVRQDYTPLKKAMEDLKSYIPTEYCNGRIIALPFQSWTPMTSQNEKVPFDEIKVLFKLLPEEIATELLMISEAQNQNNFLHWTCVHNRVDVIEGFLELIQDKENFCKLLGAQNSHGNTPLHLAFVNIHMFGRNLELFEVIFKAINVDQLMKLMKISNKDGSMPLAAALLKCNDQNKAIFKMLLDKIQESNFIFLLNLQGKNRCLPSALTFATCNKTAIEEIFALIEKNEFMNLMRQRDGSNRLLLQYTFAGKALANDQKLFIEKLLELIGVDGFIEILGSEALPNQTPLHCAVQVNNFRTWERNQFFENFLSIAKVNKKFKKKLRDLMNRMDFNIPGMKMSPAVEQALAALLEFLNKDDEGCNQQFSSSFNDDDNGDDDPQGGGGAIRKNPSGAPQTLSSLTQLNPQLPGGNGGGRSGGFSVMSL